MDCKPTQYSEPAKDIGADWVSALSLFGGNRWAIINLVLNNQGRGLTYLYKCLTDDIVSAEAVIHSVSPIANQLNMCDRPTELSCLVRLKIWRNSFRDPFR